MAWREYSALWHAFVPGSYGVCAEISDSYCGRSVRQKGWDEVVRSYATVCFHEIFEDSMMGYIVSGRSSRSSKYGCRRFRIMCSRSFPRHDVSDIGLKLSRVVGLLGFGMSTMWACFQSSGRVPDSQCLL